MSDYKSLILNLKKEYGVMSEQFIDSDNILKSIYFQDPYMKDVFNFYPDRLCIDVTHKFFEIDIFMYIFLCEDSNGGNKIISLCFSMTNDSEILLWILNTFKKHNPNWRRTKIIAIDPEIKQSDMIRNIFPSPYIVTCFHHAYNSFKNGVESLYVQNVLNDQIQFAIELFKSMYNAHSQAEYELYYQQMLLLQSSVVFYFQETWVPLQHLWRTGLDFFHENLFSSLNCHLEKLDKSIKTLFVNEDNLIKFANKFFAILSLKRSEKSSMLLFANPLLYSKFSTEYVICKVLTPYAAKFVIDQFDLSSEIQMDCSILSDNYCFDNFGSPVNASMSVCQCQFFLYTFLPCRHIFAVRKILSLCPFDETLVEYTWTMKYYQSTLRSTQVTMTMINNLGSKACVSKEKLVSDLLECSLPSLFESSQMSQSRINLLNQIISSWKSNKDVYLQELGIEPEISLPGICCSSLEVFSGVPISSQLYKIESEEVNTVHTSSQLNKNESGKTVRKIPVSSKFFKIEFASSMINIKNSVENPDDIGSSAISEISFKQSKWNFKSKILDGKHINFAFLCRVICDTKESCIDWLRQMELICTSMLCPTCGCGMTLKLVSRLSDGAVWICSNDMEIKQSCSRRCSVRRGSWFELTNMSFEQILKFCYMWISRFSQSQIISETGISTATYISWNKLNRRVCEECLMDNSNYSGVSKMDSSSYAQVLELWLQNGGGEDPLLKFLQDANAMHRKDSVKHSMG